MQQHRVVAHSAHLYAGLTGLHAAAQHAPTLVSVQDRSSQQLQGLEERMADARAQMRAAQQLAETAESRARQLLQEKEHMVSALHLVPSRNPQIRKQRHTRTRRRMPVSVCRLPGTSRRCSSYTGSMRP